MTAVGFANKDSSHAVLHGAPETIPSRPRAATDLALREF
jgi:hypothetical protein